MLQRTTRVAAALLAGLALALVTSTTAAAAPPGVVAVTASGQPYIGSLKARGALLVQAIRSYGRPTSRTRLRRRDRCLVRWARSGLRIVFYVVRADRNPCTASRDRASAGRLESADVLSTRPWRTNRGLRLGDRFARLQQLYPSTRRVFGGRWGLVPATDRFFGGLGVWWVSARVVRGRVTQFHVDGGRT